MVVRSAWPWGVDVVDGRSEEEVDAGLDQEIAIGREGPRIAREIFAGAEL